MSWVTSPPTMVWSICPGRPCLTCSSWPSLNHLKKKKKKKKEKGLTKLNFESWPKVKIFKTDLSHSVFLITFRLWDLFLRSRLGNCANCPISRKLTFAQILTKSQNFQEGLVPHNFSRRFWFWGLFLHSRIQNCSNSVILQLLALMWTLTKNQDVQMKLVLFKFSHKFWLWNPLICFGLGNPLCDPLL